MGVRDSGRISETEKVGKYLETRKPSTDRTLRRTHGTDKVPS